MSFGRYADTHLVRGVFDDWDEVDHVLGAERARRAREIVVAQSQLQTDSDRELAKELDRPELSLERRVGQGVSETTLDLLNDETLQRSGREGVPGAWTSWRRIDEALEIRLRCRLSTEQTVEEVSGRRCGLFVSR